jgi:hypothetical protein
LKTSDPGGYKITSPKTPSSPSSQGPPGRYNIPVGANAVSFPYDRFDGRCSYRKYRLIAIFGSDFACIKEYQKMEWMRKY